MWIPIITILWALGESATWVNFPMVNFPFSSQDKCYSYIESARQKITQLFEFTEFDEQKYSAWAVINAISNYEQWFAPVRKYERNEYTRTGMTMIRKFGAICLIDL